MDFLLALVAFFTGIVSLLAPCLIALLPLLLRGTIVKGVRRGRNLMLVALAFLLAALGLAALLKGILEVIGVTSATMLLFSALVTVFFGITLILPKLWARFGLLLQKFAPGKKQLEAKELNDGSLLSDFLFGLSLWPVFTVCSPTYTLFLATILPASFGSGLLFATAYALGITIIIYLIGTHSEFVIEKLAWFSYEDNIWRRLTGVIIVLFGILTLLTNGL